MSATSPAEVVRLWVRRRNRSEAVGSGNPEALLSRRREDGDRAARDELFTRFLPLARRLAGHSRRDSEPLEDVVQVASLGLLGALDRFDPARGVPFHAFAIPSIRGALKHHYRSTGWAVHVAPEAQELALRVERAAREITAHHGRPARVPELAQQLEISSEDLLAAIATASAHYALSLDAPAAARDADEAGTVADSIGAEDANYAQVETTLSVEVAVAELPERERQALTLRLDRAMTETEIARRLNCSQMQVSRLLHRAAAALQEMLDPPLSARELAAANQVPTRTRAKRRSARSTPPSARRH